MSTPGTASEQIAAEVRSWPGVEASGGDRGELAFKVGRNYDRVVGRPCVPAAG